MYTLRTATSALRISQPRYRLYRSLQNELSPKKLLYVNVTMFIVIHTYICILGNVVSELVSILQKWRMYVNVYKNMKCLYFSNDRTLTTSVLTFVRFSLFNLMSLINTNLLFMAPRKPLVTLDSSLWAF